MSEEGGFWGTLAHVGSTVGSWGDRALGVAEGIAHTGTKIPGLHAAGKFLGPLGVAAGGYEMYEGYKHGDYLQMAEGGLGVIGGGASTAMAFGATGAALPWIAGGAAALGAGLGAGKLIGDAADSSYTRDGTWGQDENGKNRSAMEWGSNLGTMYDKWAGTKPGDWSVGGAVLSGVGGIAGGLLGAQHAAMNYGGHLANEAVDGVSGWFGGLDRGIRGLYGAP